MTRFSSILLALFVSAVLFGCEPEQDADRPQVTEPPGTDMDADRTPQDGADVEVEVHGDLETQDRPTTPGIGAADRQESQTPTIDLPTQTPRTGGAQDDTSIPEVDIEDPQTGAGEGATGGGGQSQPSIPEIDVEADNGAGTSG